MRAVDRALVERVDAGQRSGDRWSVDVLDRLVDALAAVARPSPSRSSTASNAPVEAPDGTAARPVAPESRITSASTVGLPRESRIWRAWTEMISLIAAG